MQEQLIPSYQAAEAWLITAPSYLMDRFVPDCAQIRLPAKRVNGGTLRFGFGPLQPPEDTRSRMARLRRPVRARSAASGGPVFDLRRNVPQNWAHFLNNHLPIVFRVCEALEIEPNKAVLILPEATPSYISRAAALFDLTVVQTDDVLEGEGVLYDAEPWTGIRPARADWVRSAYVTQQLGQMQPPTPMTPERVFLSRRGTRALSNEADVAAWLAARGFVTIYPEDLDAVGQMHLFRHAEAMVAIHGAGLAPLLYAPPEGRLRHLVEIQPCGHMTDVYRVMAQQVGCQWIGIQGRLKPEYIMPAYDFGKKFAQFSLDSFAVDLTALEVAFDLVEL